MAERVATMPAARPFVRESKYPWEEWLDGSIWKLTPGFDFSKQGTMRSLVGQRAKKMGLKVTVRWDGSYLYIQANGAHPHAGTTATSQTFTHAQH
jgi:hypothetical protein